jgi:hypothetical protein
MEENPACRWTGEHTGERRRGMSFPQRIPTTTALTGEMSFQVTIEMLPDLALIEIFGFYIAEALDNNPFRDTKEAWIILVHVCRKWRDIVFGSPNRLNVRLFFQARRCLRMMLDTWPPLPIHIWGSESHFWEVDNIVAALEHNDRIHKVELKGSSIFYMEQAMAAMQKPFPSLTELAVNFFNETAGPVVSDLFLNGSAPLLRSLWLRSIQFPLSVLQNLLLSATNLVELRIWRIPDSGFISPETVVSCLSTLTRLDEFELGFRSPLQVYSESRRLSRLTPCVLPALTSLRFHGPCEYLEHLIAPIDSPLLDNLDVIVFHQPVLDTPQLAQFVDRTPKMKALHEVHIFFDGSDVFVSLPWTRRRGLHFRIRLMLSGQLSVMVQLCTSSFLRTLIPTAKHLYILDSGMAFSYRLGNVQNSQWLDLLRPFATVEDLYLSQKFSAHIVPALHGIIKEGVTELLPSLRNLFLEKQSSTGPVEEAIGQFVAALQLSSRPIVVSQWNRVRDPWWQHQDR